MAEPLSGILKKPFAEQLTAFRLRLGNLVPTARWDDMLGEAHNTGFMVAGATKADLLADLAAAVDKAASQGTSLEEFRRDFRKIVAERGWHGWTGEGTKQGEAWRTRVIYRTNMATSYAAGRHAQLTEGNFPHWVYRHGNSLDPRPVHLSWNGLVLPSDHPFWKAHYPPSAWGCSCYVLGARSLAAARRLGGDPGKALPPGWDQIDPKTGAPVGVGKGWDYAPGGGVTHMIAALRDKLDTLPEQPSVDLIQDWLNNIFEAWMKQPAGAFPVTRLGETEARRLGAGRAVADVSAETARQLLRRGLSAEDFARVQSVISGAGRVIEDGDGLIFVLDGSTRQAVRVAKSGDGLVVTAIRKLTGALPSDVELRRLMK